MKFFGLTRCPYCKKGINLVRVWTLKKSGEYMCPRCSGISNVYQSPLLYLFAVLAIGISFLVFFFEAYAFDSVSYMTPIKVLLPFVAFYVLSLFLIHLEKVSIRRIKKTRDGKFFDETGKEYVMRFGKLVPVKK